jgi:hypothetical protein
MENSLRSSEITDASLSAMNQSVLSGVERLAETSASKLGCPFKAYSQNSLSKFRQMSEDRKLTIQDQISVMERIIAGLEIEPPQAPSHEEWPLIEKAMRYYGLELKDDFQGILQKDDVIEIYSAEQIQIFRTFNFYEYSAYSYLDLLVNEWFHLWERPRHILDGLMAVVQTVMSGEKKGLISMDHIPRHVYKEIYNSEDAKNFEVRSVLCKFGHISPLYRADNTIGGFIVNCRVKVMGFGEETNNLAFL